MPKMKSHSGAKKRFGVTGRGKVRAQHAFTSHKFEKKSAKRKRRLNGVKILEKAESRHVRRLLPYAF